MLVIQNGELFLAIFFIRIFAITVQTDAKTIKISPEEKDHHGSKENYLTRRIPVQHWEWVQLTGSRQWRALTDTAKLLKSRGNDVTIMIGGINPGLLDKQTLSGLRKLRTEAAKLLSQENIPSITLPELDAALYADASHPLGDGYALLAADLLKQLAI